MGIVNRVVDTRRLGSTGCRRCVEKILCYLDGALVETCHGCRSHKLDRVIEASLCIALQRKGALAAAADCSASCCFCMSSLHSNHSASRRKARSLCQCDCVGSR